jgi:thiosulfate dehydrogenase
VNRSSRSRLSSVGGPRRWFVTAALVAAAGCLGLGIGYVQWGSGSDWYHQRDVSRLPSSPENDLVRYGWQLIADTAAHIGRSAVDPRLRYAGNDLACTNCHMNSGVKAFAAPFVSTFTSFPMMVDDRVLKLAQRINGCMTRSMNGRKLSEGSREMDAIVAYIRFVGTDSPQGVRVAGMGLWHMHPAEQAPDIGRGEQVYTLQCAGCHKPDGGGERRLSPAIGYAVPPLWGEDSFNAAAGMSKLETAAAFVLGNMPLGADAGLPLITEQQAWDVAAFITSRPRPSSPTTDR